MEAPDMFLYALGELHRWSGYSRSAKTYVGINSVGVYRWAFNSVCFMRSPVVFPGSSSFLQAA